MYKCYVWDMGSFRESNISPIENIKTREEASEALKDNQCHIMIGDNGDHISNYNINGNWYTLIVNKNNIMDIQLKKICEELKEDIIATTISGNVHNYRYSKIFNRAV